MNLESLGPTADITGVLVKIPEDVEQLTDAPIQIGYIVSIFKSGKGIFISPDTPESKTRRLIPTYPKAIKDILQWQIA